MAAATTPEQVCNLALGLLGQRQFIDNLTTEQTTEASVSNTFFGSTWKALLAGFDWSFARRSEVMALTTEERPGWGYCYRAPAKMVEPRFIWTGKRRPARGEPIPFKRELNDAADGHLICTDLEEARLVYTYELATVALWSPSFVQAVAAQLAVAIAGSLAVKPQLMPGLQEAARRALLTAAAIDANAAQEDEEPEAEHIAVRG